MGNFHSHLLLTAAMSSQVGNNRKIMSSHATITHFTAIREPSGRRWFWMRHPTSISASSYERRMMWRAIKFNLVLESVLRRVGWYIDVTPWRFLLLSMSWLPVGRLSYRHNKTFLPFMLFTYNLFLTRFGWRDMCYRLFRIRKWTGSCVTYGPVDFNSIVSASSNC